MLDFLLLPTSRTYWHDHVQAPNPRTESTILDSPPNTSTPAYVSLSFNGSNWIDHQGVEIFFSLKALSLYEGKLLSQEIHINRNMSNTKTWLRFTFYS